MRFFFATAALAGLAVAVPYSEKPTRSIVKRAAPAIGPGFTAQETQQLTDAFRDALELSSYALSGFDVTDSIFDKWFNEADQSKVFGVFKNILGGDPKTATGNSLLNDITIVPDYKDPIDGEYACDGETMAEMRLWDTDHPKIIVCKEAGFGHGGIAKGYKNPKVDPVVCENFDPRVSWKMETLGSILLHEYTHWKKLVAPPLAKETDDEEYGPYDCWNMNKKDAPNNADSYSWFANHNLWTIICSKTYAAPTKKDSDDPHCDGTVCKAPKGSP